jgi:2-phospho-L-lactate guanylyltransferase
MYYHALIPFKPINPKTRLSCVMNQEEREGFAAAMLEDVVIAVNRTGCSATLLSTSPYSCSNALVAVRDEGLNEAINWALPQFHCPALIIMADLPLVTAGALQRVLSTEADMAVVPGRGGGTNVIFMKSPVCFRAQYYGSSFKKHMAVARTCGFSVEVIDSFRLSTDIDEKEDLVEVLIHGRGRSKVYLDGLGFEVVEEKGRVGIVRSASPGLQ